MRRRRPPGVLGRFNPRVPRGTRPWESGLLLSIRSFNPRVPRGTRRRFYRGNTWCQMFQSTRPARDATLHMPELGFFANCFNPRVPRGTRPIWERVEGDESSVSIHASRAGRDHGPDPARRDGVRFNPRVPRGTRPARRTVMMRAYRFQSTRPARDATRVDRRNGGGEMFQSTRPARDATRSGSGFAARCRSFNPRVPRGTRPRSGIRHKNMAGFQSTRPARDATRNRGAGRLVRRCFNPRVPRGTRLQRRPGTHRGLTVSIHASRAGRDNGYMAMLKTERVFQSTRPARDATRDVRPANRTGARFNPRVPRGTRPGCPVRCPRRFRVSIHASRAGRDRARGSSASPLIVSIHASRAGRDTNTIRPPVRQLHVSIHASRAGRDRTFVILRPRRRVSIHASRAGRDSYVIATVSSL